MLDARDPEGTRNKEAEDYAHSKGKKIVLLLNKIDLVPPEILKPYLEYYHRIGIPAMLFKCP